MSSNAPSIVPSIVPSNLSSNMLSLTGLFFIVGVTTE
jgi:hypothetical protein